MHLQRLRLLVLRLSFHLLFDVRDRSVRFFDALSRRRVRGFSPTTAFLRFPLDVHPPAVRVVQQPL